RSAGTRSPIESTGDPVIACIQASRGTCTLCRRNELDTSPEQSQPHGVTPPHSYDVPSKNVIAEAVIESALGGKEWRRSSSTIANPPTRSCPSVIKAPSGSLRVAPCSSRTVQPSESGRGSFQPVSVNGGTGS